MEELPETCRASVEIINKKSFILLVVIWEYNHALLCSSLIQTRFEWKGLDSVIVRIDLCTLPSTFFYSLNRCSNCICNFGQRRSFWVVANTVLQQHSQFRQTLCTSNPKSGKYSKHFRLQQYINDKETHKLSLNHYVCRSRRQL